MNEDLELKNSARTEEIQHIIDRMPSRFGLSITGLVMFIFISLVVFGWLVKYPDVVTGQVIINSSTSPVKLVANATGNIQLYNYKSQDKIKKGDYIAIIKNPAQVEDVQKIQQLLKGFDLKNPQREYSRFPQSVSLGDLNTKYFAFINALEQYVDYQQENLLTKQEEILRKTITEQQNLIEISRKRYAMSYESSNLTHKFYQRDSVLYAQKVLTESEMDKSEMNIIAAKDASHNMLNNIISLREQIQETRNKLQQIQIQKNEKEDHLKLDLFSTYTELSDNIKLWEQRNVFKSPIDGKLQFLKFWTNDQFIQAGEPVFTIVPDENEIIGQMVLPATGAGKVKVGQEIIVKLDNYPYAEYGSIKGKVMSISLTTNPLKTEQGELETYLVSVELPNKLTTNYGSKLDFKFEIKGSGEIITNDRRLAERLFDNLKYIVHK